MPDKKTKHKRRKIALFDEKLLCSTIFYFTIIINELLFIFIEQRGWVD